MKGQKVTNDRGWTGWIESIEDCDAPACTDGKFYYIYWKERAEHADALVRKNPVIGHNCNTFKMVET